MEIQHFEDEDDNEDDWDKTFKNPYKAVAQSIQGLIAVP